MGNVSLALPPTMGQGLGKKHHFGDDQTMLFCEVFTFFDQNNDGQIELEELILVFERLGVKVTVEELKARIDEIDGNQDGKVSFTEFVSLMESTVMDLQDNARLKEAFAIFDSDGNGEIDIEELSNIMHKLGQPMENDQLKEMIHAADFDRNKTISFDEFKKFMQSPL